MTLQEKKNSHEKCPNNSEFDEDFIYNGVFFLLGTSPLPSMLSLALSLRLDEISKLC